MVNLTSADLQKQIQQKRLDSIRIDQEFKERVAKGVRDNPTAPSSAFNELRQQRQNILNDISAQIKALNQARQQIGQGLVAPGDLSRFISQTVINERRDTERSVRAESRASVKKLAIKRQQLITKRVQQEIQKINRKRSMQIRKAKTPTKKRSIALLQAKELKEATTKATKKFKLPKTGLLSTATKNRLIDAFDKISGGSVTESRLNKRQNKLNEDTNKFNKNFGSKKLSEKQFKIASETKRRLDIEQKNINKGKEALANSLKTKVGRIIGTLRPFERLTEKKKAEQRKQIPKFENRLKQLDKKIKTIQSKPKKTILDKLKLRTFKSEKFGSLKEIERIKAGKGPTILTGDLPIVPATRVPTGITKIKFLGSQKTSKSGKVVTDIIFKTSKGNVGIARGVAVQKGKAGQSVVLGRFAEKGVRFPSGKVRLGKTRSFAGIEKTISKTKNFKIKTTLDLIKKSKKVGKISLVKSNVQGLLQRGVGRTVVAKGKRLTELSIRFPSGKLSVKAVKGISVDDFSSISSVLSKKDLSLIIGKSITGRGAKAKFIGFIKGTSKVGKGFTFSGAQKQQFARALKKVISATSSALATAEQTQVGGASKLVSLASASNILSKTTQKTIGLIKPKTITIKQTPKPAPTQITKKPVSDKQIKIIKSKVSGKSVQGGRQAVLELTKLDNLQDQLQKQKQKQNQLQKQLQKTKQTQRQKQLQKQLQKQKQKLTLQQKQVQTQIRKINTGLSNLSGRNIPKLFVFPRKKKRRKTTTTKKKIGYNVFVKSKGKFIKINKTALSKTSARDLGTFAVDHTTARTLKIVSVGKVKRLGSVNKKIAGHFTKTRKKFRSVRIKKGKKKALKRTFIERKGKPLIDTRGEKRGLSIAKFKRSNFKTTTKRSIRRSVRRSKQRQRIRIKRRKPSPLQLKALSRGRAKRLKTLRAR